MLLRLIAGAGLLALGYYVGKQVGRMEPIREDLERRREAEASEEFATEHENRPMAEDPDRGKAEVYTVRN